MMHHQRSFLLRNNSFAEKFRERCLITQADGYNEAIPVKQMEKPVEIMSEQLLPRAKASTIDDVARAAGVSKMTVSFALNGTGRVSDSTRQTVLRVAQELSFAPNPHAKRLSQGRCGNMIGLFALGLNLGAGIRKTQLIQRAFMERGYEVPLYGYSFYDFDEKGARQIELMKNLCRQRPRAVVCNTSALHPGARDELGHFQQEGGVVVLYDEPVEGEFDHVLFDRAQSTHLAARHLLELGHRRIALAGCNQPMTPLSRFEGYKNALKEFEIEVRPDWLFLDLPSYEVGGAALAERFVALDERPTALCIVNDWTAATFVLEMGRRGIRVPDDVSIISLDDLDPARYAAVPLSAVSQPIGAISDAVVELLMSRLEGRYSGGARQIVVRGELISRQSTARPDDTSSSPLF